MRIEIITTHILRQCIHVWLATLSSPQAPLPTTFGRQQTSIEYMFVMYVCLCLLGCRGLAPEPGVVSVHQGICRNVLAALGRDGLERQGRPAQRQRLDRGDGVAQRRKRGAGSTAAQFEEVGVRFG